jgi:quinol monooxygenase YgiN
VEPVTIINHLEIKPGRMDEFIKSQQNFANDVAKTPCGLIGGRMYRSVDGRSAVLVSVFSSVSDREALSKTESFKRHLAELAPMVESTNLRVYEAAYTTGDFK